MAKQQEQEAQAVEQVQEVGLLDQILTEGRMARDEFQKERAKDMIGEFVNQVMSGELTISKNMDAAINARIAEIEPANDDVIEVTRSKRSEPRIPFGWVVERGLLPPGTVLQGSQKRHKAKVRADGSLVCADASGSIHRMGAHVQGLEACNGWTFWHFEVNGTMVPIDVLRQQLRAGLT